MAKAYQHDARGYFAGEVEDHGGPLPNNATRKIPKEKDGHIPQWTGKSWKQIEDHTGEQGYLNGEAFTITKYGPYPQGWSAAPPPSTLDETLAAARMTLRTKRKDVEYGGFTLDGQQWDSEEKDELRLNSVSKVFEAGIPAYKGWKIREGIYITLTPEILSRAAMALMQHYGNAFAVETDKLAELAAMGEAGRAAIEEAVDEDAREAEERRAVSQVQAWMETEPHQGWQ